MNTTLKENAKLAPFTTLGVGGPAKYLAEAKDLNDLKNLLTFAKENRLEIFVLGGGSNILVSDEGFDGLVILNKISGITATEEGGNDIGRGRNVILGVGAGENWDKLVKYTVQKNLSGLETLSGIPGSVGAAPVQNIGAYGGEIANSVTEVIVHDLKENILVTIPKKECKFSYRQSIFNTTHLGRYIILEVKFKLTKNGKPKILYQDLVKHFENKPEPSLSQVREAVLKIRAQKGRVIHPRFKSYKTAGSFFKNPIVDKGTFNKAQAQITDTKTQWSWQKSDGDIKISAAKLIEKSGFKKGYKSGNVGISPKHALAIINLGNAKAQEILDLVLEIRAEVENKFGIKLAPEVTPIGFPNNPFA